MKKSNNPNAARELQSNWAGGRIIQCHPLVASQNRNYKLIMTTALWNYKQYGRKAAVTYLQAQRPWLIEYCNETNLPASGTILDGLLAQEKAPFTHPLFQSRPRRRK